MPDRRQDGAVAGASSETGRATSHMHLCRLRRLP